MKPFFFVYSTFLQRAFDHIMLDVCYQNLPVVFMVDRAGIVGEDGETHHGIFDLSFMGAIPGLTVAAPSSGRELVKLMRYAATMTTPMAIRYPRAVVAPTDFDEAINDDIEGLAKSEALKDGTDVEIRAVGRMTEVALDAAAILDAEGISTAVAYDRFVIPPDAASLERSGAEKKLLVTLEDGVISGGFGERVSAILAGSGCPARVLNLGWPDEFITQGSQEKLFALYGLDAAGVAASIRSKFKSQDGV
jgi:1-deoxy-D-xylulose-5-phosphate synthase